MGYGEGGHGVGGHGGGGGGTVWGAPAEQPLETYLQKRKFTESLQQLIQYLRFLMTEGGTRHASTRRNEDTSFNQATEHGYTYVKKFPKKDRALSVATPCMNLYACI